MGHGGRLTDTIVEELAAPSAGNSITYDRGAKAVSGFGARVTANGAKSFILNYRTRAGRERRYTIGPFGKEWSTQAARNKAAEIKRKIPDGYDPLEEVEADRSAYTMADLCERFESDHLPRKRPATQDAYKRLIRLYVLPEMKNRKVEDIQFTDVDRLHLKITKAGKLYQANRLVALLSKLFSFAIKLRVRSDNPAKGVERNQEEKRQTYLSVEGLERLIRALDRHEDQQGANIIRLLLLTGARRGEVQSMRWDGIDLKEGRWTKPAATTKQKKTHIIPLAAPACALLAQIHAAETKRAKAKKQDLSPYVFPGRSDGHRINMKDCWAEVCKEAKISGVRLHDLRHSYASFLASGGASLPLIGALLGHTNPTSTNRYVHLFDDPQRAATERVGVIVTGAGKSAEVVQLRRK